MKRLFLCDFDGTISLKDVSHHLLTTFTNDNWQEIEHDFISGRLGSKEAYERVARLLKGSWKELHDYARDYTGLDPYFQEFYHLCKENDIAVKIVSDGFDFYISALLDKYNLGEIEFFSNQLISKPEGGFDMKFPYYNPECCLSGTCKGSVVSDFRQTYDHISFVGNGISDRCGASRADTIFAKGVLYQYCQKKGLDCFQWESFLDIINILKHELSQK
ncbi:MAG: MtnX-like HAD-IB family phosphatase [Deltaproteobacteria bacterium]|nr:MAG: MtnX-like HAD-IB family phosphatase [Deltaproteobacteria bacterium]